MRNLERIRLANAIRSIAQEFADSDDPACARIALEAAQLIERDSPSVMSAEAIARHPNARGPVNRSIVVGGKSYRQADVRFVNGDVFLWDGAAGVFRKRLPNRR